MNCLNVNVFFFILLVRLIVHPGVEKLPMRDVQYFAFLVYICSATRRACSNQINITLNGPVE